MQFDKPYSESTAQMIDEEVRTIVNLAYERTKSLLSEKREIVEKVLGPCVVCGECLCCVCGECLNFLYAAF